MKEYEKNEIAYLSEGRIELIESIELTDIEEILRDKPNTRNQPDPTQTDSSQLVNIAYKAD